MKKLIALCISDIVRMEDINDKRQDISVLPCKGQKHTSLIVSLGC